VEAVEKKGHTALHLAALRGNFEIMKVLLDMAEVDVNAVDKDGSTALHIAGMKNASSVAAELISYN
jgi:ankyrin repeat protein